MRFTHFYSTFLSNAWLGIATMLLLGLMNRDACATCGDYLMRSHAQHHSHQINRATRPQTVSPSTPMTVARHRPDWGRAADADHKVTEAPVPLTRCHGLACDQNRLPPLVPKEVQRPVPRLAAVLTGVVGNRLPNSRFARVAQATASPHPGFPQRRERPPKIHAMGSRVAV